MKGSRKRMDVQDLRFYGHPFSDAKGFWPKDVKRPMNKKPMMIVAGHFGSFLAAVFSLAVLFLPVGVPVVST